MRFALSSMLLVGMIVTVMVFLADFAAWTNDQELAYEIALHDLQHLLADCGEDLVCDRPPSTACRHSNKVLEIHADLGYRRRFPFGASAVESSLYFDAGGLGIDTGAVKQCTP